MVQELHRLHGECSLGQNSEVENFPPLFRGIPDPERSAYVPAQQNPQTQKYGVRYQTRSYSRAVAQTNTENEKSLESNKTVQGTVQSDLGESTATAVVSLKPRTTRSMAWANEQAVTKVRHSGRKRAQRGTVDVSKTKRTSKTTLCTAIIDKGNKDTVNIFC